jgi:hypothetical protein
MFSLGDWPQLLLDRLGFWDWNLYHLNCSSGSLAWNLGFIAWDLELKIFSFESGGAGEAECAGRVFMHQEHPPGWASLRYLSDASACPLYTSGTSILPCRSAICFSKGSSKETRESSPASMGQPGLGRTTFIDVCFQLVLLNVVCTSTSYPLQPRECQKCTHLEYFRINLDNMCE